MGNIRLAPFSPSSYTESGYIEPTDIKPKMESTAVAETASAIQSTLPSPLQCYEDAAQQKAIIRALVEQTVMSDESQAITIAAIKVHQAGTKALHRQEDDLRKRHASSGSNLENMQTVEKVGFVATVISFLAYISLNLTTNGIPALISAAILVVNVTTGLLSALQYGMQLKHHERMGEIRVAGERKSQHQHLMTPLLESTKKESGMKAKIWKILRNVIDSQKLNDLDWR